MTTKRRARISAAPIPEGGGDRARGGRRARPLLRSGREEVVSGRRRPCGSCSGATSCPGYDAWFDGVYTKEWGAKNGTDVIVDHMSTTEINARGAAEAAARKGHDLFLFISPPAAYENQVIDHREIVDEVEKRHGKMIPLAEKSTLNPKTGKYFAFSDSFVPGPGQLPDRPLEPGRLSERPRAPGRTCGSADARSARSSATRSASGLSQEMDSNMALRGLLWSFGGSVQDADGRPVLQSKETIAALEFLRALYKESDDARGLHLGSGVQQPDDARRPGVLRLQRDLRDAHGREGEPRAREEDRPRAGARRARCGASPPSTS